MRKSVLALLFFLSFFISVTAQPPRVPESYVFAGQVIRFDKPDLYERMDRELMTFSFMHTTSTLMLKRSSRIFAVVEPILKEQGVPDDLKYLMVIESNLDPQALSPAGAAGLWQFMAGTAREFGLEVNTNVDERYNIEKATVAACKYLKGLYRRFGDWMSVAASYNAGPASVSDRMEGQKSDDALDLWLPSETSRYMFRMITAKMMFEHPEDFGFNVPEAERYPAVEVRQVVTVTDPIPDLAVFANSRGISYATLKRANLWLRESKLNNASHRAYKIIIPAE